ncbi:hypothetical protein AB0875_26330 [Micromonospora gifhornensis]|uniref:hypothetical protein n=1 Tax=Micromonospora gifhornensis TaxID=84594 RepID=UPI0034553B2E
MTEEHVWPEWFQRELVKLGGRFTQNGPGRETSPLGPTVQVCAECNNRWLSVLDNDVKPGVVDMWKHRRFLEPDEQELLATWATGRAVVMDAHQAEPLLPQFFAHELRVSRKPAPGTWVWATGFVGPSRWMQVWYQPLRLKPRVGPAPKEPNGLSVTFTAFRVAFQVVFTFWRGTYDVALNYDVGDSLTPLWPIDGQPRLFPSGAFDFEAILDVAERFIDKETDAANG